MTEPVPLRKGTVVEADAERELLDFAAQKIRKYTQEHGSPPTSIAIVLSGQTPDGQRATLASSWDQSETRTRMEVCSLAAAMLMSRAIS